MMRIFIDTANVDEIREVYDLGILSGVTTNPTLVAREGRDFFETVREIASIVGDLPISAEVVALEAGEMVEQGKKLAGLGPNIVVKVPMTADGLKAASRLKKQGIQTNVTLVFTPTQALLAARAGAAYVSPFIGRLDDINQVGMNLIREVGEIFRIHRIGTEIISASVRHAVHVIEAAMAGADIATVPYKVIMQMLKHPLTDAGIERFLADWNEAGFRPF